MAITVKAKINRREGTIKVIGGAVLRDYIEKPLQKRILRVEEEARKIHMTSDYFCGAYQLNIINI